MRIRPIHHTFGPHVSRRYALRTDRLLLTPWHWRRTEQTDALRTEIATTFGAEAALFSSGREALLALLRALQFEPGAEIIIQGYTCVALPNAIHAAGYTPVYADIDTQTLNLDITSVQGRLSHRTRAIICQHTFGIPADTTALRSLCDRHNLVLIEDCAHVLPDSSGPEQIGRHADALMLSFGRDKAVSGISGGAALCRNTAAAGRLRQEEEQAEPLPMRSIARLLLYAPIYHKTRMIYGIGGKILLSLSGRAGLLAPVLAPREKTGTMPTGLHRIAEPCAALARTGLQELQRINDHRRTLTATYAKAADARGWRAPGRVRPELPLQKFPLFVQNADALRKTLKHRHIYLDDGWTGAVVCPRNVDQESANYLPGSCPHAEYAGRTVCSLPTHPTMTEKQAEALLASLTSLLG